MPPATIAGSIAQSGVLINGAVHVNGSNCLDRLTTIGLTGTLTEGNVALTSTSADGQVITFGGSISKKVGFPYTFTRTYAINGGTKAFATVKGSGVVTVTFTTSKFTATFS